MSSAGHLCLASVPEDEKRGGDCGELKGEHTPLPKGAAPPGSIQSCMLSGLPVLKETGNPKFGWKSFEFEMLVTHLNIFQMLMAYGLPGWGGFSLGR